MPILTPAGWTSDFHTGVDLAVPRGTRILAPAACIVVWSGIDSAGAHVVVVRFDDGTGASFVHMDGPQAGYHMSLRAGDTIGFVGTTGQSTGPHLHYSRMRQVIDNNNLPVWYDRSVFIDPMTEEGMEYPDSGPVEVPSDPQPLPEVEIDVILRLDQAIAMLEQGAPMRVTRALLLDVREALT